MSSTTQLRTGPGTGRRSTEPRSAARSLAELDARQGDLLLALQDPESVHAEMLTALMVSNSLLELSKLATARLNLAEFSRAALTTVMQCTPVTACALYFSAPDVPPVHESLGGWLGPQLDETEFLVVNPDVFFPDYVAEIDDETADWLGLNSADDACLLVIVSVRDKAEDATANLLGPLVINRSSGRAIQAVLSERWSTRQLLFANQGSGRA